MNICNNVIVSNRRIYMHSALVVNVDIVYIFAKQYYIHCKGFTRGWTYTCPKKSNLHQAIEEI